MNIPPGAEAEADAIQQVAELGRRMIEENKTALEQNTALMCWEDPPDLQEMLNILKPFETNPQIWRPVKRGGRTTQNNNEKQQLIDEIERLENNG